MISLENNARGLEIRRDEYVPDLLSNLRLLERLWEIRIVTAYRIDSLSNARLIHGAGNSGSSSAECEERSLGGQNSHAVCVG